VFGDYNLTIFPILFHAFICNFVTFTATTTYCLSESTYVYFAEVVIC